MDTDATPGRTALVVAEILPTLDVTRDPTRPVALVGIAVTPVRAVGTQDANVTIRRTVVARAH